MSPRGFTRRGLLGALGGHALGALAAPRLLTGAAAAQPRDAGDEPRNAVLIVTSSTRADFVGAFEDSDSLAKTPNLDSLAKQSLRFEQAVAESMATVPARRALLTGMRSFPFRDWRRTEGLPPEPGWNPIRTSYQPIVTDVMRRAGITTAYATDHPFLVGPHFANFRATVDHFEGQLSQASWRRYNQPYGRLAGADDVRPYLPSALRGSAEERRLREYVGWNARNRRREQDYSTARVVRDSIGLLRRLKKDGKPFFLGVDLFDPSEPFDPPASYLDRFGGRRPAEPIQPFETPFSRVGDLRLDDETVKRVRQLYAAELTFADAWIGRLLDELERLGLTDNTLVYHLGDHGVSLGERGVLGRSPGAPGRELYRIPCMIRHPAGHRAGDKSDWFASTHDTPTTLLSFLGVTAPGKMIGEDLTVFFDDEEDPPERRWFSSGIGTTLLGGDEDWLLVTRGSGDQRRLYDLEEDERQEDDVIREHPNREEEIWAATIVAAGGNVPQFDENHAVRPHAPPKERIDLNSDDELGTQEDQDLQDLLKKEESAPPRPTGRTQGISSGSEAGWALTCTVCGFLVRAAHRQAAVEAAESHFQERHPDLAGTGASEEMVREGAELEATAAEQIPTGRRPS